MNSRANFVIWVGELQQLKYKSVLFISIPHWRNGFVEKYNKWYTIVFIDIFFSSPFNFNTIFTSKRIAHIINDVHCHLWLIQQKWNIFFAFFIPLSYFGDCFCNNSATVSSYTDFWSLGISSGTVCAQHPRIFRFCIHCVWMKSPLQH